MIMNIITILYFRLIRTIPVLIFSNSITIYFYIFNFTYTFYPEDPNENKPFLMAVLGFNPR